MNVIIISVALVLVALTAIRWFGHWRVVSPNEAISSSTYKFLAFAWILTALVLWWRAASPILPSPWSVLAALPDLWNEDGLAQQLWVSFAINLQAIGITVALSLALAYSTVMPVFRPPADFVASGRFNGFVGLPLILTLYIGNPHWIKVALLVYAMSVFSIPSIVQLIEQIPKEEFDHARTLRMREWRVVWEVVILGRFHDVLGILRGNITMGWMMLPMVEGLFRGSGGLGALVDTEDKHFMLAAEYAIVFVIIAVGFVQDYAIGIVDNLLCPYSKLGLERT